MKVEEGREGLGRFVFCCGRWGLVFASGFFFLFWGSGWGKKVGGGGFLSFVCNHDDGDWRRYIWTLFLFLLCVEGGEFVLSRQT